MKRIILAAIAAAAVGLTACGSNAAPADGPGVAAASHKSVRVPVSCGEQYGAWARGRGKGLVATVAAVSSAATVGGPQVLRAALKKARPAVALAARHQMPGCADPRGYWYVLLMHINAAAAKGSPASSRQAALKDVPKIQHRLTAELKQTTQ